MKDLTNGNIYKTFILFAIPMALAGLLSCGFSIINTVIAGKFLGEVGLAAVGATAPLLDVISSVFWGYGVGFSVYIAKLFGAKEYKKIKESIITTYFVIFVVTIVAATIMIIFHNQIFDMLRIEDSIRHDAYLYFLVYMIGFFFIIFTPIVVSLLNAFGISKYPLYMTILSAILTVLGNIFSVTVLHLGVMGIALSTVISALIVTIFFILEVLKCFKEMGVYNEKVKLRFGVLKESFSYSGTVMIQQLIMYIAPFVLSPYINAIGSSATAAYTVITRIYNINASIYQNSAKTLSNYAAQCMGAKKYNKIGKGVFVGFIQSIAFVAPTLLICVFLSKQTCALFFQKGTSEVALQYAVDFSRIYLPFVLFNVVNNLFHSFFRGVNAPSYLLFSTLVGCLSRIIASIIFINQGHGMYGVYLGWVASWIIEAVFVVTVYYSGKWKPLEMTNEI